MAIIKEADITEGIETTDSEQQLQIQGELPVLPLRISLFSVISAAIRLARNSIRAVERPGDIEDSAASQKTSQGRTLSEDLYK